MDWVKLDTNFFTHPKAMQVGPFGRLLYITGLCWSGRHEVDGQVPRYALPALAMTAGVPAEMAEETAQKLVTAGLWDPNFVGVSGSGDVVEDGWVIHGWADHQPTREELARRRSEARDRKRRFDEKRRAERLEMDGLSVTEHESHAGNSAGNALPARSERDLGRVRTRTEVEVEVEKRYSVSESESLRESVVGAEAPPDTSSARNRDPLTSADYAEARELCILIAERFATHSLAPARRKVTASDVKAMDLLIRRGPADLEGVHPVPVDKVRAMVDFVFRHGTERNPAGFCWADQVRSGSGLRKKWTSVRTWANAEHARMRAEPAAPRYTVGGFA